MDAGDDEVAREAALFTERIDPTVRKVLDAEDPWDAYDTVGKLRGDLFDDLDWLPHGGGVFVAWAEVEDLYETGKTPIPDAHAALRQAATAWLARPSAPDKTWVEGWIASTQDAVKVLIDRDGDFWRSPS